MAATEQSTAETRQVPGFRIPIPNSQSVLLLGIFSLVTTCCCGGLGFVGLILGILAVILSSKALETYERNPGNYTEGSYKNLNGGRICGIIGIIANGLLLLVGTIYLLIAGASLTALFRSFPWEDYL